MCFKELFIRQALSRHASAEAWEDLSACNKKFHLGIRAARVQQEVFPPSMALLVSSRAGVPPSFSVFNAPKCTAASWWSKGTTIAPWRGLQQQRVGSSVALPRAAEPGTVKTTVGGVTEVDKDTFWPLVEEAGDNLVVLDMYTQWCGPCKLMYPKIVDLSTKYTDVLFLKLDCNQHNKLLAKELGVRVVPTFKILKHRKVVGEVKGAKFDELVQLIDKTRTEA